VIGDASRLDECCLIVAALVSALEGRVAIGDSLPIRMEHDCPPSAPLVRCSYDWLSWGPGRRPRPHERVCAVLPAGPPPVQFGDRRGHAMRCRRPDPSARRSGVMGRRCR
jgi:hypothetical protein